MLWRCWLGSRKGIRPVENWVVGCWSGYLSGARCRLAYGPVMPLPLTASCFSKIQIGFTFLVLAHPGTHTRLTALSPGLPRWAGTRKEKPIWILLKQETVCGSGISWNICKSAPRSRQITMPTPHHSVFYRPDALPVAQPTASKHWRHKWNEATNVRNLPKQKTLFHLQTCYFLWPRFARNVQMLLNVRCRYFKSADGKSYCAFDSLCSC